MLLAGFRTSKFLPLSGKNSRQMLIFSCQIVKSNREGIKGINIADSHALQETQYIGIHDVLNV